MLKEWELKDDCNDITSMDVVGEIRRRKCGFFRGNKSVNNTASTATETYLEDRDNNIVDKQEALEKEPNKGKLRKPIRTEAHAAGKRL